jgi:hypothetical protein
VSFGGCATHEAVVTSKASTVDEYLAELPDARRPIIEVVRRTVLDHVPPGIEEGMQYGMIGYLIPLSRYPETYNGQPLTLAALANQKRYISLYLMGISQDGPDASWFEQAWTDAGKKLQMGRSCVRFTKLEDVPLDVVGEAVARISVDEFIEQYERARGARGGQRR